jgi:hypothetical protein
MAPPAPLTERHLGRATLARQGLLDPISGASTAVAQVGSLQAQHPVELAQELARRSS